MKALLISLKSVFHILFLAVIICGGFSCKKENESDEYSLTMDKLYWVVGEWKGRGNSGVIYEKWSRSSDKILKGAVYSFSGLDTIIIKQMRIEEIDDNVYYVLKPAYSNSEVYLTLTDNSSKGLLFENPDLEKSPARILYGNTNGDMLLKRLVRRLAELPVKTPYGQGKTERKTDTIRFYMNRDSKFILR